MSYPQRPDAVVFDMDGLMVNTEDLYDEVGETILRRRGREFTNELKRITMGLTADVSLQVMIDFHDLDATVRQLKQESDEIFDKILADRLAPMAGLPELLDALEAVPIPKSIATGSDRSFTKTVLGYFGYEPRFQFV